MHLASVLPVIPESLHKVTAYNSWLLKEIVFLHQEVMWCTTKIQVFKLQAWKFWPSVPVHHIKQIKNYFFIFVLPSTPFPKRLGERCRGNIAAVLCLQHTTIPKLLTETWVQQLSRSTQPLDFQHAALTLSVLSHLNTFLSLTARSPRPCCPLLLCAPLSPAVPISCPGRHVTSPSPQVSSLAA